jgi:hypothetical protein
MVGSGRRCLWNLLGGFSSCRGEVSTAGIVSAARFQRCKFRLIRVSIHGFSLVKASSWLLSSLIFTWPATEGSVGGDLLFLPGGDGGEVVNSQGLEEEAQFNIPVPSRRGPAQHTSDYGW